MAKTSISFFIAAAVLALLAGYSFFSPLALRNDHPLDESALRAAAHFLPVLPPWIVGWR